MGGVAPPPPHYYTRTAVHRAVRRKSESRKIVNGAQRSRKSLTSAREAVAAAGRGALPAAGGGEALGRNGRGDARAQHLLRRELDLGTGTGSGAPAAAVGLRRGGVGGGPRGDPRGGNGGAGRFGALTRLEGEREGVDLVVLGRIDAVLEEAADRLARLRLEAPRGDVSGARSAATAAATRSASGAVGRGVGGRRALACGSAPLASISYARRWNASSSPSTLPTIAHLPTFTSRPPPPPPPPAGGATSQSLLPSSMKVRSVRYRPRYGTAGSLAAARIAFRSAACDLSVETSALSSSKSRR